MMHEIGEYVGKTFDDAGEFCTGMVNLRLPDLNEPAVPNATNALAVEIWKIEWQEYNDKLRDRQKNSERVTALVLGQCSQALHNQLGANKDWQTINDTSDAIGLLQLIQRCMSQRQTRKYDVHALINAETELLQYKQGQYVSNNDYFDWFKDKLASAM